TKKEKRLRAFQFLDAATGQPYGSGLQANWVTFSPDGKLVFFDNGGMWALWGAEDNSGPGPKHDWDQHPVRAVFNHDGSRLVVLGDGRVPETAVWDPLKLKRLTQDITEMVENHRGKTEIAVSPDGKIVVFNLDRGRLCFWPTG